MPEFQLGATMSKITISMPERMSDYVARRVASGQYGNVSEFFRDLVRHDQERQQAIAELRELIDAAEASGLSPRQVPDIMKEVEDRLRANGRLPADEQG
jgi:antitoxin ParD1/3/4